MNDLMPPCDLLRLILKHLHDPKKLINGNDGIIACQGHAGSLVRSTPQQKKYRLCS